MRHFAKMLLLLLAGLPVTVTEAQTLQRDEGLSALQSIGKSVTPTPEGVRVEYHFPAPEFTEVGSENLMHVHMAGMEHLNPEGVPDLPYTMDSFEVPSGQEIHVSVTASHYTERACRIPNAPPLLLDIETAYEEKPELEAAVTDGWYPAEIVGNPHISKYRGHQIAKIGVFPVQYDSSTGITRIYDTITYEISYTDSELRKKSASGNLRVCNNSETIDELSRMLTYYAPNQSEELSGPQRATVPMAGAQPGTPYLILSHPSLRSAVERFARWKQVMGYNVRVQYNSAWDTVTIRKCVWDLMPNLLLIFGDENMLPGKHIHYRSGVVYNGSTDFYYACIDDETPEEFTDDTRDMIYGRIPASNVLEAHAIVSKIIEAEGSPSMDSDFYNTAAVCGYFQSYSTGEENRRFIQTSEEVRNYLLGLNKSVSRIYRKDNVSPRYWNRYYAGEPLVSLPEDLLSPDFAWNGNGSDVIDAVNSGTGLICYRGHGSRESWANIGFGTSEANRLSNTHYPMMIGLTCLAGDYSKWNSTGDCLSEVLLKKSSGGVAGIIGSSLPSYSLINCEYLKWIINILYPTPGFSTSIKKMAEQESVYSGITNPMFRKTYGWLMFTGLDYTLDNKKEGPLSNKKEPYYTKYSKVTYNYLGDPAMSIYPTVPQRASYTTKLELDGRALTIVSPQYVWITIFDEKLHQTWKVYGKTATYTVSEAEDMKYISYSVRTPDGVPTVKFGSGTVSLLNQTVTYNTSVVKSYAQEGSDLKVSLSEEMSDESVKLQLRGLEMPYRSYDGTRTEGGYIFSGLSAGVYVLGAYENGTMVETTKIVVR